MVCLQTKDYESFVGVSISIYVDQSLQYTGFDCLVYGGIFDDVSNF